MMSVDPLNLSTQFHFSGEQIYDEAARWINYSVSLISYCSQYIDSPMKASFVFVGLNIVFLEIAIMICKWINNTANFFFPYEELSDRGQSARKLVLGSVFVLMVSGANHVSRKMLKIHFSAWKIAAIGLTTQSIWLMLRIKLMKGSF